MEYVDGTPVERYRQLRSLSLARTRSARWT
jgi:hypothetical protein